LNAYTDDIYDIKSRLAQYPLLQDGAKGELLLFIFYIICIFLIINVLLLDILWSVIPVLNIDENANK